jgi:four helix bundle protein
MSDGKMMGRGDQLSERLLDFVVKVLKLVDALPKTVAGKHIAGQLAASGSSSGANYEEGCAAESRSDFVHKLSIVLKELKETRYWLRVIHQNEMLAAKLVEPVINECEQLCAIIGKSISTARKGKKDQ